MGGGWEEGLGESWTPSAFPLQAQPSSMPQRQESNSDTLSPGAGRAGVRMGAGNVASQSRENDPRRDIPLWNANAVTVTRQVRQQGGTQAWGLLLALPAPARQPSLPRERLFPAQCFSPPDKV